MADLSDRLSRAFTTRIERDRLLLAGMRTALEGTSPLAVLARGYCIAEKDGKTVKSARDIVTGRLAEDPVFRWQKPRARGAC